MGFLELLLIGVGLSMDAFAVAVCQGLCMPKLNLRYAAVIALFFGGFQALMPFIGWALGTQFESYITSIDHWPLPQGAHTHSARMHFPPQCDPRRVFYVIGTKFPIT